MRRCALLVWRGETRRFQARFSAGCLVTEEFCTPGESDIAQTLMSGEKLFRGIRQLEKRGKTKIHSGYSDGFGSSRLTVGLNDPKGFFQPVLCARFPGTARASFEYLF